VPDPKQCTLKKGAYVYHIDDRVRVVLSGKITRIEGGYSDNKVRYFVQGEHCITAVVTDNEIDTVISQAKGDNDD
jgi:hypothetical protein